MPRVKTKEKKTQVEDGQTVSKEVKWEHGEYRKISIGQIEPNEWNPFVMDAPEFDMLVENMDDIGNLQPVLVVPSEVVDGVQMFKLIDGEKRYEAGRLRDDEELPAIIADPDRLSEIKQKFQTMRFNKIKGHVSPLKFKKMVEGIMQSGEYTFDDLAHEMGFTNQDEFQSLIEEARENLSPELRDEFDKVKDEIKTVDDLSLVLNRLFTQFGDTLPANFMILDFGGKQHIWVRMQPNSFKAVKAQARECMVNGITFDSIVSRMMLLLDVGKFIEQHRDFLEEVPDDQASDGDVSKIDDLL